MIGSRLLRQRTRSAPDQAQLMLVIALVVLMLGAWVLTISQARTMDMPMGIAIRGMADGYPAPAADDAMSAMPGMAMPEPDTADTLATTSMSGMGWSWEGFTAFVVALGLEVRQLDEVPALRLPVELGQLGILRHLEGDYPGDPVAGRHLLRLQLGQPALFKGTCMRNQRLLGIVVHLDDESRIAGGALATYASQSVAISLVVATCGKVGSCGEPIARCGSRRGASCRMW